MRLFLAVLCKYERKEAPKIIKQILEKLRTKTQNEHELHEYVTDLEILSNLRNLQRQTKKELNKMPIIYVLTKDIRFKEGKEIGEEKGIEKGVLKQARSSTIRLLKRGILSPVEIAEIQDVPLAFVLKIQKGLDKNPNLK